MHKLLTGIEKIFLMNSEALIFGVKELKGLLFGSPFFVRIAPEASGGDIFGQKNKGFLNCDLRAFACGTGGDADGRARRSSPEEPGSGPGLLLAKNIRAAGRILAKPECVSCLA
ncbi:hypothetical protein CSC82_11675 [Rhodobacteraceae bacterium 4F10]|nr:hypothetical protein CSC82_11675 [Rhodobacteraceae bacterium 4F10]